MLTVLCIMCVMNLTFASLDNNPVWWLNLLSGLSQVASIAAIAGPL